MIYTVTFNPSLDYIVRLDSFTAGEINRVNYEQVLGGGKGINVSKVLRELGEPSVAAAILGGAAGRKIESALRALGIEGMYLFTGHETRTNLKIVDPTLHTNTDVNEPGAPADEAVLSKLLTQLTDRLRPGDLVVLSGKAPAGAPDTLYRDWILACRAAGAAVYLDAEGELLRQGVKTKTGRSFTRFSIKSILQNPVYLIADKDAYQYFVDNQAELFAPESGKRASPPS